MTHPIVEALQGTEEQFTELRRHFHQHPEIGFEEHQTSEQVARLLTKWGYEVHRGLGGTGVVGTLKVGNGSGPVKPTVNSTAVDMTATPPRCCTPRNICPARAILAAR
jgi:metal-dependent amidase/aminoacylase/carboxypeptidase family protein